MIEKIKINNEEIIFTAQQRKIFSVLFNEKLEINTENKYRCFGFFGGIRAGKSFLYQLSTFLFCVKYPKLNVLYIRKYYHELEDSVISQFLNDFEKYGKYTYVKTKREARFKNGAVIKFRALDEDGTSVLSSEYDLIVFCQAEEIEYSVYLVALGRLSGKTMPKAIMMCEGNPDSTWVKEVFKDSSDKEKEEKKIFFLEVETKDNLQNLSPDYIQNLKANYPDFWIRRYLFGEWENVEESVFSEFREKEHVIDIVPPEIVRLFKMRQGLDYGWVNPTAIVWGYIDYDGNLTLFDEWGGTQKTPKDIARESKRFGKMVCVADYSIKKPDRDGRSLWDDLLSEGMNLRESNKQELQNIVLVNSLLKTGRLRITRNCVNLLQEIKKYKWKRLKLAQETNRKEEPVQKNNHFIDAMLYLIASLEELKIESPQQKAYKNSIEYKTLYPQIDNSSKGLG